MNCCFEIPGQPKGKGRPRMTRSGYVFTPKDTVMYENLVKMMYASQVGDKFLNGAIKAEIIGYFSIPKSTSKKKRTEMLEGKIEYTHKIDCDNLAKVILDSLNKVAYHDDSQVTQLYVSKKYAEEPKVVVTLTELGVSNADE